VLFIWRLWLEKIDGSFVHLEALAEKEIWECYNREGTVSVLVGLCKPMTLVPMFRIVHDEVKQKL
jgi:hypothetical protein